MTHLKDRLADQIRTNVDKLKATASWLKTPAMAKIVETCEYLSVKHDGKLSCIASTYGTTISISLSNLDGLKDEGLAALLDGLVHSNPDSMATDDDARSFARTYRFHWHGSETKVMEDAGYAFCPMLAVYVVANFKSDSDTCKRVIVGYTEPKTKPEPIYKLTCNGDTDAAPETTTEETPNE